MVDPNRKDVYVSYHGVNDLRRLSSAEYYDMNGKYESTETRTKPKEKNKCGID
ncbi:uncharacterized protein BX663DRAFT_521388 [Cokeromyces recurvatus]|uniref:uncharacterized protein n=1 Tax=Cokeromyces recurvatus TaxID=90255 RepID=UPI00221ED9F7|nr:uncharacterized protein BX663DRAFT_521388 [Cokeromyces recurvatus]KAI7899347.1 hypothetical protein BX663DRAFT_521388 [Cokeromyces recurvatus]